MTSLRIFLRNLKWLFFEVRMSEIDFDVIAKAAQNPQKKQMLFLLIQF